MRIHFILILFLFGCCTLPPDPPNASGQEREQFVFLIDGKPASEFFRKQLDLTKDSLTVGEDRVGKNEIFDVIERKVYPAGLVAFNYVDGANFLRDWHLRFTTPFDTTEVLPDSVFFTRMNGGSDVKWRMGAEIGKSGRYFVEWFNERSGKWVMQASPHVGNPRGFLKGPAKKRGRKPKKVKK